MSQEATCDWRGITDTKMWCKKCHILVSVTPLRSQVATCDIGHWTCDDFILWYIGGVFYRRQYWLLWSQFLLFPVLFICFVCLKTFYVCPRLVGLIILSIVCCCRRKGKPGGGESMSEPDVESSSSAPATLPCPTHPCAFSSRDESLTVHVSAAANPNTAERCRPMITISSFSNPNMWFRSNPWS